MAKSIPKPLMITDVTVKNYHRNYTTESLSGLVNSRDSGVQWFSGTLELTAYGFGGLRVLNGFVASLRGRGEVFKILVGGGYANAGIRSNPKFTSDAGVGSSKVTLSHVGEPIDYGSVFTVPNDPKLYTLLSSVSGSGTHEIVPALKTPHSVNEPLNFMNPEFTVRLTTDETTVTTEASGMVSRVSLSWKEVIRNI